MTRARAFLVLALLATGVTAAVASGPAPVAAANPGLAVDDYRRLLQRLRGRTPDGKARSVAFRFGHQFEDTPEIIFTEITRVSGEWLLVRRIWTHEQSFRKGDPIDGASIIDITRNHAVCEYKKRTWQVIPRTPPPTISCTGIKRKGDDWVAALTVSGEPGEYRKGDDIQGAQVAEITSDCVECVYFGIKGTFKPQRAFPALACRLTCSTPQGWQLFVQEPDGLKTLRVGDLHHDARVKELRADSATFEFEGREQRFPLPELPVLAYTGRTTISGRSFAYLEHRGKQYAASPGVQLDIEGKRITIEDITPARVKYRFNDVPLEIGVR